MASCCSVVVFAAVVRTFPFSRSNNIDLVSDPGCGFKEKTMTSAILRSTSVDPRYR